MHHKRKGPKSTRAGCLLCKPHKHQANSERTIQEQRENPLYPPERRSRRRKDTTTWCRGKIGRLHTPQWVNKGFLFETTSGKKKRFNDWKLCCDACGKHLGYYSTLYRDKDPVRIMKFPGWEAFKSGPPISA